VIVDRPMTIGELADRAVTVTAQRWTIITVFVLVRALPLAALQAITVDLNRPWTMLVFVVPLVLVLNAFTQAGIVFGIVESGRPSIRSAANLGRVWFGRALATDIASVLALLPIIVVATLVAWAVSAAIPAVPRATSLFWTLIVFGAMVGPVIGLLQGTAAPVALLEDRQPFDAVGTVFRRLRVLGIRRTWLVGMLMFLVTYAPAVALAFVVDALPTPRAWAPALAAAQDILQAAVSIGVGFVLGTLLAIEIRIRTEGHDLALELQSATSASPTLTTPGTTTSQ
jgi:hypothetical protein